MTINDINLETLDLCDATTTSYTAANLLRRINEAYERVVGWILESDGRWQWDDTNYSDFPIGKQTLVNSQHPYSFNDKFLEMQQVEILTEAGDWVELRPIDESDYSDAPLEQIFETDGQPQYYDKIADDTIKLYPAPDNGVSVTLADGLRIRYRRTADIFTSAEVTTGTKVPGFSSPFHSVLSYMAAIPYCMKFKKDRVALYEKRVSELKRDLMKQYSFRERDREKRMIMSSRRFK